MRANSRELNRKPAPQQLRRTQNWHSCFCEGGRGAFTEVHLERRSPQGDANRARPSFLVATP